MELILKLILKNKVCYLSRNTISKPSKSLESNSKIKLRACHL